MSNCERIYMTATLKRFLQVGSNEAVVVHHASTGLPCSVRRYRNAAQAERAAFERYENFHAQRREQLAAGEQSSIVQLEKFAAQRKGSKRIEGHGAKN
jgi:hypothetical protein